MRIGRQARKPKTAKVGQWGRGLRHVTYFYNFGTPSISLERIKLHTSNLVRGLNARPVAQKVQTRSKGTLPKRLVPIGTLGSYTMNRKCGYGKTKNGVKFYPRVTGHVAHLGTVPKLPKNMAKMQ